MSYKLLDTIKLVLDTSPVLLGLPADTLTEANRKSINHTISDAHRILRESLNKTYKDQEDDD